MNRFVADVVFHDAVTVSGTGVEYSISLSEASTVSVEITGTATAFEVVFEGKRFETFRPKFAINESSGELIANGLVTVKDQAYQIDLTGLSYFRAKINSVSGGNLTVKGRFIK